MRTKQSVLVTGGAGFIGANLCRALIATERYDVIVIDDLSTGCRSNLDGLAVTFHEASILDPAALTEATPAGGALVHLAGRGAGPVDDPVRSHEVDTTGSLLVLEAARAAGLTQVIVVSSPSILGDEPPNQDPPLSTISSSSGSSSGGSSSGGSSSSGSRLTAEGHALAQQQTSELGVLAFRLFNVFGPLQSADHADAAVIPSFIDQALREEALVIHGDGKQSRDFTYVGTVAATIVDAIDRGVTCDSPVNLASGSQVSLLEVVDLIGFEVGRTLELTHVEPRRGDIRQAKIDLERLHSLFGDIEPVDIATGIRRTVDWFKTLDRY